MIINRKGKYGAYYGNDYNSSDPPTISQMQTNALYIYSYLLDKGWSANAIAGVLGNMEVESGMNPGRWQSDRVKGEPEGHGYSLVQWTPYTKYTDWCSSQGYSDPSEMDTALARIMYEVEHNIQWYGTGAYSGMSFEEFSKSSETVGFLAVGFLLCYERPLDQSESVQNYRTTLAEKWYTYLTGKEPIKPGGSGTGKRNKKFNFILFNRKRGIYG